MEEKKLAKKNKIKVIVITAIVESAFGALCIILPAYRVVILKLMGIVLGLVLTWMGCYTAGKVASLLKK